MKKLLNIITVISVLLIISCDDRGNSELMVSPQGKGGSMARFALGSDHLYVVDNRAINVYETAADGTLAKVNRIDTGFGIETIFARDNNLFLGATNAMYIYDISKPSSPEFVSRYDHFISCDPVVVNDNFAYVTLRVRGSCHAAGSDALEVINISDLRSPILIQSYNVETPYGLGVDNNTLFLCKGDHGVSIYNVSYPKNISLIKDCKDIHAFDVIPNNGVFIVTGNDGIFQYDYADLNNIHLLSQIPVQQ